MRILALAIFAAAACGGSAPPASDPGPPPEPPPEPEAAAPAPEPAAEPEPEPEPEPPAQPAGPTAEQIAAAVDARIADMPRPPIDGARATASITRAEGRRVCTWMSRIQGPREERDCPDGSHVTVGASSGCDPAGFAEFEGCEVTLFEMAACFAGMRDDPCGAGIFGANLPECAPFLACIARQFEAAQAQTPPEG